MDETLTHKCWTNNSVSTADKNKILTTSASVGFISVVCCTTALILVCISRLYRHFIYRLALYQVLASLCLSVMMVAGLMLINYKDGKLYYRVTCQVLAFLDQFCEILKLFFTCWLTFHLFLYVVFFKNFKKLELLYISSSLLVSLVFAFIPLSTSSYGVSGAWCYIRSWKNDCDSTEDYTVGIAEQFSLYYGPATLFLVLNIIAIVIMIVLLMYRAYKSVRCRTETQSLTGSNKDQRIEVLKQLLPLLAYPIIYFSLFVFAFANRIYMAKWGTITHSLVVAQAVTESLKGLFSGLALIIHVAIIRFKMTKRSTTQRDDMSTISGVTPYTSGASTHFTSPNETDVDIAHVNRRDI